MYVKDHFWDRQRLRKIVSAESALFWENLTVVAAVLIARSRQILKTK